MPKHDPNEWLTPKQVRKRYKVAYPQLLSMRLARFPDNRTFPVERGPAKRKILRLKVTRQLHDYLRKFK